ncbi:anti-sigma F factor antagonist [Clostridium acetireducens DSM 10703]|jgi:stage II sporulation protein AA (anti-sigma F factor antagonist)|uniref:Anti-sigma F factor antagonist n=1 Tax=Clostridium acetireducens DSM 10703 TaxID=1121290 RepID=A0A1E8EWQ6_9CLOT|nr:anti-sigma F factor antagonist [Clostridium acetireducens]OFI04946.1 anti-sigma F factor antagonist [Clostridium acetireducens DSM 10703]
MLIDFEKKEDKLIAHLVGELDHHSAEEVRIKIDDRLQRDLINKLIMDFSKVTFMDSSGIGVVIGRYKKLLLKNGVVCITNVKESVKRVFELSGMFKIIPLYNSVEEALKNI